MGDERMMKDEPMVPAVAIYLRKSRAEEGEDTDTVLSKHEEILLHTAKRIGVTVHCTYKELASGDSLALRPQMSLLLQGIAERRYSAVLCMDIDRLGRGNMIDQGLILETLKSSGTAIITPEKTYDLNDELDETQTEFKIFFARQELKMIKKRLERGIRLTLEKGGHVSSPPYGYDRVYVGKIPSLRPNEEAEAVKLIFYLYLRGLGCDKIAQRLSSLGYLPQKSSSWNKNSIRKILTNEIYTGIVARKQIKTKCYRTKEESYQPQNAPETFQGLHPAIIDRDVFERTSLLLQKKYHVPYRSEQTVNPLAGVLRCRKCGRMMVQRTFQKGALGAVYLLCPTKGCVSSVRAVFVEQEIIALLDREYRGFDWSRLPVPKEDPTDGINGNAVLKAHLKKLRGQLARTYDLLEEGVYTKEQFLERQTILAQRAAETELRLKRPGGDFLLLPDDDKAEFPTVNTIAELYQKSDIMGRNILLKALIDSAYYLKEKRSPPRRFELDITINRLP